MSGVKSTNSLFFKLKFCKKLTLEKSNKYALDLINIQNVKAEDLINFSNLVEFNKEIFFEKLLELNNTELIVGYIDFLINSGNINFINLKYFNKLFEIYLKNTDKDITDFILNNCYYMNSDLLIFIFNYYFKENKLIINKILCDTLTLNKLIDYIDNEKVKYIKKYVFQLIRNSEYRTAEQILNILYDRELVDSDYARNFEKALIDKSDNERILRQYIIEYYNKNIDNENFSERGDNILNQIIKIGSNKDIYYVVKILLSRGNIEKATYVSKFIKISDKDLEINYYSSLLKLSVPIAVILEKDRYLDKRLILNIIKKDKLKLYIYGQEIINGYNFNNHEKNVQLDNKYIELLKNNMNGEISDDKVEKEFNRIDNLILKINRYNAFFSKNIG